MASPDEQKSYLQTILNLLIMPLLLQINQERVLCLKQLACDSVLDLLRVLEHLQMWAPLKKVVQSLIKLVYEGFIEETA